MTGRKHRSLNLNEKLEVIRMYEDKIPIRMIQQQFKCGKTQVYAIIKNKDKIKKEWLTSSGNRVRKRKTTYGEIDKTVYEWFTNARNNMLPVSGPMLQEQAKKVAEALKLTEFKASNGWLDSFKKRHQIALKTVNGEPHRVEKIVVKVEHTYDEDVEDCVIKTFEDAIESLKNVEKFVAGLNNETDYLFQIHKLRCELEKKSIEYETFC